LEDPGEFAGDVEDGSYTGFSDWIEVGCELDWCNLGGVSCARRRGGKTDESEVAPVAED
jgi:hypothetical protein